MQNIQLQITADQLLEAIKQLPEKERIELFDRFGRSKQKPNGKRNGQQRKNQAEVEADLLARTRLNSSLPDAAQRTFNRLRLKLRNETITKEELKELQLLTSRSEAMAAERLASVIELARLRGTDFDSTWQDLGLSDERHAI